MTNLKAFPLPTARSQICQALQNNHSPLRKQPRHSSQMRRGCDNAPFVLEGQTAEFQHCVDKTGFSREERGKASQEGEFQ